MGIIEPDIIFAFDNPPTGRQVEVQGIIFARIANSRMVEDWTLVDQLGILQQLGLVPPSKITV